MMRRLPVACAAFALCVGACSTRTGLRPPPLEEGAETARAYQMSDYPLIPVPTQLTPGRGIFQLDQRTTIAISDPGDGELRALADYTAGLLAPSSGQRLRVSSRAAPSVPEAMIILSIESAAQGHPEGYRLDVSSRSVELSSSTHAGLFYGLQTIRQLLNTDTDVSTSSPEPRMSIPAVLIEDAPRFNYRGMHLDVGRHYFSVAFIKRYIDLLAMYKLNTFHWHLTEDQGWRLEIKKYPRLTEVGAYRKETILDKNFDPYIGDKKPYGGYYTQDEVRDIVAHARRRYVNIIPEIEMPGHSTAALAAYPELACTEGPFEVATVWGIHEDIYCPSERTFEFLQDVLTEVMELFPSRYIHIGGDEAPKKRWEESELAQEVMRREGLADEHELQSYFISRIELFLLSHGRRLIGWDEILEGGLAPEATVMSWRGTIGGIEAARQGHDVVMTPYSHVYFDYYQGQPEHEPLAIGGYTPLEKVYEFEPIPEELTPQEARHILGAQGNVWTEYMLTPDYVEYMVLPRMLALSEVVWSPRDARDWKRFLDALPSHFRRLDGLGHVYRIPHVRGLDADRLTLDDQVTLQLQSPLPGTEIRYTIDGSDPTVRSQLYSGPVRLPVDEAGVRVAARVYTELGRSSPPRSARFARTTLRPAATLNPSALGRGLRYRYYEAEVAAADELAGFVPTREGVAGEVALQGLEREAGFGLEFSGYIRVPESTLYTFYLTSDDGSRLRVGDQLVIDNDGYHGPAEKSGMVALQTGFHPITIRYFQAGGGKALSLAVATGESEERRPVADWLFHDGS